MQLPPVQCKRLGHRPRRVESHLIMPNGTGADLWTYTNFNKSLSGYFQGCRTTNQRLSTTGMNLAVEGALVCKYSTM